MGALAIELMMREAADHYQAGRNAPAARLCDDVLKAYPDCVPALHLNAVIAFSNGRAVEGTELLERVFRLDPDHVASLLTLGDALAARQDRDGAAAAYRRALQLRPVDVSLHDKLGAVLLDSRRFSEAASIYRAAIALDDNHLQLRFRLAVALAGLGQTIEAHAIYCEVAKKDASYEMAWSKLQGMLASQRKLDDSMAPFRARLASEPDNPAVYREVATTLYERGLFSDAVVYFNRAAILAPDHAPTIRLLCIALQAAGRAEEAIKAYRSYIALREGDFEACNNLSGCLIDLGRFDEAGEAAERALQLNPAYAKAHINLGIVQASQNKPESSVASYRRAISLDPNDAGGYANLSVALHRHGDLEGAEQACRSAIGRAPDNAILLTNLAGILHDKGEVQSALETSHRAVALAPHAPLVRFNHSQLLLINGDLKTGFADYRWRGGCFQNLQRCSGPAWNGEAFVGRKLLLFSEQGIGDVLHFIRYLPMVKALGGEVILQVPPALVALLSRLNGVTVIARDAPLPSLDLQLPLMDLAHVFGTTLQSIPAEVPYLHADPESVERWRETLGGTDALKVGVVWAGSPTHKGDRYRSIAAQAVLEPLVMPGVQLYSLQKEWRSGDDVILSALRNEVIDLAPKLGDFSDTAAALAALDILISVDTSVAHLAGAMGRPVWVMLPFAQDWRWMLHREDSPWYPTMRLFRQQRPRAWDGVIARVTDELGRIARLSTRDRQTRSANR